MRDLMTLLGGSCKKIFLIVLLLLTYFTDAHASDWIPAELVSRTDTNYTISFILPEAQSYESVNLFHGDPVTCNPSSFYGGPFDRLSNPVTGLNYYTGILPKCSDSCIVVDVYLIKLNGTEWAGGSMPIYIPQAANCSPPVADAGSDQTVVVGDTVILDGTRSSDPDENIVNYTWTQVSGTSVTLTDSTNPISKFTAPCIEDTLTFALTVTDSDNQTNTATVTVTVKQCALTVQPLKQNDSLWGTDIYDNTTKNISKKGCALTSAVMVLSHYGITIGLDGRYVNPKNLNEWLIANNGYDKYGDVRWDKITKYSGGKIDIEKIKVRDDKKLNDDLINGSPVILDVSSTRQHFVVATGAMCAGNETTWTINDPGYDVTTLQGYGNTYRGLRRFILK